MLVNEETLQNKFFHTDVKGCEMTTVLYKRRGYTTDTYGETAFCVTHDCEVCRCGYEVGFHYSENSNKVWGLKQWMYE